MIVVVNASDQDQVAGSADHPMKLVFRDGGPLLSRGDKLERVPINGLDSPDAAVPEVQWHDGVPQIELRVGPESVNVYRRIR